MIEPNQLREQLAAARRFEVEFRGARFRLRLPTEQELRRVYRRHVPDLPSVAPPDGPAAAADAPGLPDFDPGALDALQRDTVLAALEGWDGVSDSMVLGEPASGEAVAFDAALAAEWLQADAPLADRLSMEVFTRVRRRREAREADAKN